MEKATKTPRITEFEGIEIHRNVGSSIKGPNW